MGAGARVVALKQVCKGEGGIAVEQERQLRGDSDPEPGPEEPGVRPATDEEVQAAVEAFFARYRRVLERLATC